MYDLCFAVALHCVPSYHVCFFALHVYDFCFANIRAFNMERIIVIAS